MHGTKVLVMIAISLSLSESIIRQPETPQALQPNPMHMVGEKIKDVKLKPDILIFITKSQMPPAEYSAGGIVQRICLL